MEDLLYNSTAEGKIIHTFFVKVMAISKKCKAKFDAGILLCLIFSRAKYSGFKISMLFWPFGSLNGGLPITKSKSLGAFIAHFTKLSHCMLCFHT